MNLQFGGSSTLPSNNASGNNNELADTSSNSKNFKLSAAASTSGANILGSNTLNSENDQFRVSGGFSGVYRGSMDA